MNKLFIFVLGAAAGSVVTWQLVKEKYRRLADEEIESVIETFKNRENEEDEIDFGTTDLSNETIKKVVDNLYDEQKEDPDKTEYKELIKKNGYFLSDEGITRDEYTVEVQNGEEKVAPYTIPPEEYGEYTGNNRTFTYWSDLVLTDEDDQVVTDYEDIIGDALEHFGEYEDDSVYVRNENLECDCEILKLEEPFYKETN